MRTKEKGVFLFILFVFLEVAQSEANKEVKVKQLVNWFTKNGGFISKLEIKQIPGYGLGIVAKEEIRPNELILRIPGNCNSLQKKLLFFVTCLLKQRIK